MRRFASTAAPTLAIAIAVAGLAATAFASDNPFDHVVPLVKVGDALPATRLVDQGGHAVGLDELRGAALAIGFIYTRCKDACPIVTRKFGQVRALLGDGPFRLIEITIDPEHDTAAVMAMYAHDNGMDAPRWLALTGAPNDVDDFNRRLGVQAVATGRDEIVHDERVVIAAPDGVVTNIIDGSSWTAADLAAQVRHVAGLHGSLLERADLALGAAAAFCGGALTGRAGIGDLFASFAVIASGIALFAWFVRRTSAARA